MGYYPWKGELKQWIKSPSKELNKTSIYRIIQIIKESVSVVVKKDSGHPSKLQEHFLKMMQLQDQ